MSAFRRNAATKYKYEFRKAVGLLKVIKFDENGRKYMKLSHFNYYCDLFKIFVLSPCSTTDTLLYLAGLRSFIRNSIIVSLVNNSKK